MAGGLPGGIPFGGIDGTGIGSGEHKHRIHSIFQRVDITFEFMNNRYSMGISHGIAAFTQ